MVSLSARAGVDPDATVARSSTDRGTMPGTTPFRRLRFPGPDVGWTVARWPRSGPEESLVHYLRDYAGRYVSCDRGVSVCGGDVEVAGGRDPAAHHLGPPRRGALG